MKRIIACIMSICMVLSVLSLDAFVITSKAAKSGYFTYEVINGETTITDCDASISGEVIIPSELSGCPVTSIGEYAFSYCSSLTSVEIPEGVTSIGEEAFYECSSLISVEIPEGVTSIGDFAFRRCSSLTSVEIPESVTSIGRSAFSGCSSLTSVEIPDIEAWYNIWFGDAYANPLSYAKNLYLNGELVTDLEIPESVTSIGSYVFNGCSSLTSVEIPEGVTSIGISAFCYCSRLTSVEIPESVTSIGYSAFDGCSSLTSVEITDIEAWCNIWFGNAYSNPLNYAKNLYLNGELVTDLEIPESVTSIGSYVFEGCSSLTSVEIPEGVTSIGEDAFSYCSSLTSVEIPEGVTSIGLYAFEGCSSLTSVEIPEGVTSIGACTFYKCSSLTSVEIPEGVTSIGEDAFCDCSSLTGVWYCGSEADKEEIFILFGNSSLLNATWHYNICSKEHSYRSDCAVKCTYCDWEREPLAEHTYISDCAAKCAKCDWEREPLNEHSYTNACDTSCNNCGEERVIAHTFVEECAKPATLSKDGQVLVKCSTCGYEKETFEIFSPKSVILSDVSYTYDGKVKKPSVIVKDRKGRIIPSEYYTVTYPSGLKKVGTYKVKITFKGNYSGTMYSSYTINPVETKISKITVRKKQLIVKYAKKKKEVTGYEVQYSTNKKFKKKSTKTAIIKKNKTTKVTLKKLKAKKTYYIRVRTYKTVGGKNYYSGWSVVKTAKTK